MIKWELTQAAVKTTMMLLRACGPCEPGEIRGELLDQCIGVDSGNVQDVYTSAMAFMTHKRFPMIERYDDGSDPADESYWLAPRMFDSQGNYKGAE